MYWRDLSPHAREVVLRMLLAQPPAHFRHVNDHENSGLQMCFMIDEEPLCADAGMDPQNDLTLAMRLGCRWEGMIQRGFGRYP